MSILGEILLERAWITEKQLAAALERQQQMGGRLGTCLTELGMVNENLLLRVLSEQLGVPPAQDSDLEGIHREIIELLPAKVAVRARAVPFRATTSRVDVAMLDIGDITLEDELSFLLGKTVRFHIATELRIAEALSRYYGREMPPRLAGLSQRLAANDVEPGEPEQAPKPPTLEAAPREPKPTAVESRIDPNPTSRRSSRSRQQREEPQRISLTDEERRSLAEVRSVDREPRKTQDVATEDHGTSYIEALTAAETSSEIGTALLGVLGERFTRVLLFKVSGSQEEVTGWLAAGPDIDRGWFRAYSAALQRAAVFELLYSSRRLFHGRLEEKPGHRALARSWGGSLGHECIVLPIAIRDHLVCIVYVDRGTDEVSAEDLERAEWAVGKAALAFERCILRHKLRVGER